MEDEGSVKAPVTRLRRRLSVEQTDDAKSSSAPNTPTKKRGGRRAAKPELDLIDENAPENDTSKKPTKKANMKELDIEEKPVTPSRRSARIKSNTSIVLETTQAVDSPRAKRATRRNSQVGSDNEAPLTPARLTRRTRRDSANADKAELPSGNKSIVAVTEIIVEEPEPSVQKTQSNADKSTEQLPSPSGQRRSPRLTTKRNSRSNRSDSIDLNENEKSTSEKLKVNKSINSSDVNENEVDKSDEHNNSNKENEISPSKETVDNISPVIQLMDVSNNLNDAENNKLSTSNIELLNKLNTDSNKKIKNLNMSLSGLTNNSTESFKNKRQRTKSWTSLSVPIHNDNKCYSDSESVKKTKKLSTNTENTLNISTNKKTQSVHNVSIKEAETSVIDSPSNRKKSLTVPTSTNLFDKEPTNDMTTLVYIEESDSNSEKIKSSKEINDEDQPTPTDQIHFNNQETLSKNNNNQSILNSSQDNNKNVTVNKNDSCEPMDVDETLPDNIIANKSILKTTDVTETEISSEVNNDMNISANGKVKESRKSSITLSTSLNLDKTTNENKSTLVISQLKDISNEDNIPQSPQIVTAKQVTNSDQTLNFIQDVDKKELSSNYLTSTPLQQKSLNKHAIHVNSSGINSNNTSKIEVTSPKRKLPNTNKSKDKSEESESGEESSQEESNLIDDEAEEASDDYESGDSRDEEDVQYEKENEIIQKGETLTSEDELSNDSDYEKDSFIVSSDQEDDELLDGSGDDLSKSDNELKMTTASKKKYNERKIKEQKKASREMFESRHKLNISNKDNESISKKQKRTPAILDSSDSEDEEIQTKIKKNRRMRLDSSHEISVNNSVDNKSNTILNSSVSKLVENDANEVEMTIIEENIKNDEDPLTINIKQEINTPQKKNTSIQFIDPEESDTKGNKSHLNTTTANDPLEEGNVSESSDSSDNELIQNYDSILNDLNESVKTKKNKKVDISLNIDKKTKHKSVPIVDQLNLTQTKTKNKKNKEIIVDKHETLVNDKTKKKSNKSNDESHTEKKINKHLNVSSKKSAPKKSNEEESDNESSASIDLHLLFSEDSNNSEDVKMKNKKTEQSNEDDSFIPLKKSHGKTNIFETSESKNNSHTESVKKNKRKSKALDKSNADNENDVDETEVKFFLDTTGTHNSTAFDQSINGSARKKKGKRITIEHDDADSDAPMEISNKDVPESQEQQVDSEQLANISVTALNKSKTKTPKSEKKKKKSDSFTEEQADAEEIQPVSQEADAVRMNQSDIVNKSMAKTPKSEKKKAKKSIESQSAQQQDVDSDAPTEIANKSITENRDQQLNDKEAINISMTAANKSIAKTPKSEKKKKRASESERKEQADDIPENEPVTEDDIQTNETHSGLANKSVDKSVLKTPKSEKKKAKKTNETLIAEQKDDNLRSNKLVEEANNETICDEDVINTSLSAPNKSMTKTPKSEKKKKRISETQTAEQTEAEEKLTNLSVVKTPKSEKKKKKLSESVAEIEMGPETDETSAKTTSAEKKKSKKISESDNANNIEHVPDSKEVVGSKKRKRKSSLNQIEKDPESEDLVNAPTSNVSTTTNSQSKKRKITHNIEESENIDQASKTITNVSAVEKQQTQEFAKQRHPLQTQINNKRETPDVDFNNRKVMKKRKEREDDEGNKTAKMLRVDTNDKIPVPRLPASVLNQLEDRPTKKTPQVTKPKAISTTNFVVEETRVKRTKPSNYLEESIYLNEDEEAESKKPKYIKNPKVLPFLPTVSTSHSGYTTNFKVNVLPKEIQFVAKSSNVSNYKNDYLQTKKIKRLGTYELYKRNRTVKMSKF